MNGLSDLHDIVAYVKNSAGSMHGLLGDAALDVYMECVVIKYKELHYVDRQVVEYTRMAM